MGEYYAYVIGDDGHITRRIALIGPDDAEAKRLAKQLVDGHAVELWQGAARSSDLSQRSDVAAS
jgi:hypothetical protein